MPEEVQGPEFWIDRVGGSPPLTILARDGKRLVEVLERHAIAGPGSAAAKIRKAMQPGEPSQVELAIGEDEAVLRALVELQQSGDFREPLSRLVRELKEKLKREP